MKRLMIAFIVFILAVFVGLVLVHDPGYILLAYSHYTVEMPLWLGVIIALVLFVISHYFFRFFLSIRHASDKWQLKSKHRKLQKAHTLTGEGLLDLIEARWSAAEKNLLQGIKSSSIPVINYLGAAFCATEKENLEKRDAYLAKAHECAPDEAVGIYFVQAQLQITSKEYELAIATLKEIEKLEPKHPFLAVLQKDIFMILKEWNQVLDLLPKLKKQKYRDYDHLELEVYQRLLLEAASKPDELDAIWAIIPRYLKKNQTLKSIYGEKQKWLY